MLSGVRLVRKELESLFEMASFAERLNQRVVIGGGGGLEGDRGWAGGV